MPSGLRIGVVARDLEKKGGGTKVLLEQVLKQLHEDSRFHQIHIIHRTPGVDKKFPRFHSTCRQASKPIFDFWHVPRWTHKHRLDVVVYPKNIIPWYTHGRRLLVVLDLACFPILDRMAYRFSDQTYMRLLLPSSCRRADHIAAISTNTKNDLMKFLHVEHEKITVIPLAASDSFSRVNDNVVLEQVKQRYQLPNCYLLFTGGITPRKNLTTLVRAFEQIRHTHPELHLVLTGSRGWHNKVELALIAANPAIHRLGFVPDEDMPALYTLATMYAYPSLYEGFGLPVLEAQACGCPVIASNTSSIPEAGGDGVRYIVPGDVESVAEAMAEMLTSEGYREMIVKKGTANVGRFSWRKTTDLLLDLCEQNAQSRGGKAC